jgi:hypothetical protein
MGDARIERVEIMRACEQLSTAFCHHADHGNFTKVGNLFTPTGTFDRFGQILVGPAQIAAAMSKRPADIVTRHGLLSVYFTVVDDAGAEAIVNSATFYGFTAETGPAQLAPGSPRVVEFRDRYRLFEGQWRIESRVGTVILNNKQ